MILLSKLKKVFTKKKPARSEPDRVKNEIAFTDLNKTEVVISVKHIDQSDLLFITIADSDDFIVLDQEAALVLQAVMADFGKGGNLKTISKLIGEK